MASQGQRSVFMTGWSFEARSCQRGRNEFKKTKLDINVSGSFVFMTNLVRYNCRTPVHITCPCGSSRCKSESTQFHSMLESKSQCRLGPLRE
jgi:hypothetical protein